MLQVFSSILAISYLVRIAKHLSLRTSWYVSPIIIFPFLTSIYKNTFISFILNPEFNNFSLYGLNNLITQWFNGNSTSLFLIGLLFFAEKVTLPSLGFSVLLELLFIFIGSSIFLLKILGFINGWPIIMGLLLSLVIHSLKRNKQIFYSISNFLERLKSYSNFKVKNLIFNFKGNKEFIRFLSGASYFFLIVFNTLNFVDIQFITSSHILRMLFFIAIFILLLSKLSSVNKKIISNYIPIIVLYSSISLTSFFNTNEINISAANFNLNCITSIAFLPLLEYLYVLYYGFKSKINANLLSIKFQKFLIIPKVGIFILISCYASYVLTSA